MNLMKLYLSCLTYVPAFALAQVTFPVFSPKVAVGDLASYRAVEMISGMPGESVFWEVVSLTEDRILVQNAKTGRKATFSMDWNLCRRDRKKDAVECEGNLKFPLMLGNKHSYSRSAATAGVEGKRELACEVVKVEAISAPAGTFETVRIDCTGFWTVTNSSPPRGGPIRESTWYAPAISRIVRHDVTDIPSGPLKTPKLLRLELVEWK